MTNNIVKKLQRSLGIGVFTLAATVGSACGDTYEGDNIQNYPSSGSGEENSTFDCGDVAYKSMECGYHDGNATLKNLKRECENANLLENIPEWVSCVAKKSCEELQAGQCDQYFTYEY